MSGDVRADLDAERLQRPAAALQERRRMPQTVALVYCAVGTVWILLTDMLVGLRVGPEGLLALQTLKELLFVAGTALALYLLLARQQRRDAAAMTALLESRGEVQRVNATLEQRVQERTRMLEAANRELEAFAYAVSHDLRAPLRSLSGFSQILQESAQTGLDEQSRHYLQRIQDSSQRMAALIDDLLSLSRINRTELAPRQVDLSRLYLDAAAIVRERYPHRTVDFNVQPGMQIHGDPRLLRIAVENLLDNAWKYTGRTAAPRVAAGIEETPGGRAYFVRDNGAGFDMAYAGKLFGPFQRLHAETQFPGTGIGLVTVQRILARHQGRIWVQAALDRGATFYFTVGETPEVPSA